jgi:hypothetical protein
MAYRNPRGTLYAFPYKGFTEETHRSILAEVLAWGGNLTYHDKGKDANIDRARSKVASWFLSESSETAGDVLMMVDADNAWQQGDLAFIAKRALERDAVVGGIYPKRAFNAGAAMRLPSSTTGTYKIGDDALIPAEFVGTGFIAIPRSVLERVAETLPTVKGGFKPFFMPEVIPDENGEWEYPTDDQAFCWRVRQVGCQVLASTYPRVTHAGDYEYRMVDTTISPPPTIDVTFNLKRKEEAVTV